MVVRAARAVGGPYRSPRAVCHRNAEEGEIMLSPVFDPSRDLQISRVIKAPRSAVWHAWTERASFEQWWVPAPAKCRVQEMDLRPGGALITRISEGGGDFVPHLSACFLAVDEL